MPFRVAVSVEPLSALVAFEEGVAHGYHGGVFPLTEALKPDWQRVFEQAEGTWLLRYLRRPAEGERVRPGEPLHRVARQRSRDVRHQGVSA